MRHHRISEDDLAELERTVPQFMQACFDQFVKGHPAGNRLRVQFRRMKEILSDVRWDYCPPGEVHIIPADGPAPEQPE